MWHRSDDRRVNVYARSEHQACSLVSFSRLRSGCGAPFRSSPKMDAANFGHLLIVLARVQLSSLYRLVWCPTLQNLFPFDFLTANQNSSLICWWYISNRASTTMVTWISETSSLSVSVSVIGSKISFSYIFLSFPPSSGRLLKQSTGVPN